MKKQTLGVGIVGGGFNGKFHIRGWTGVRGGDILGIYDPALKSAEAAAGLARKLHVGEAKPYKTITDMVADPAIDAIWLCGPNQARIENVEELTNAVIRGRGALRGLACEKPLARNVAEAKQVVAMTKQAGLRHGYLENQVFAPQVERGKTLLWALRGGFFNSRQARNLAFLPYSIAQLV